MNEIEIVTNGPEETIALGNRIGAMMRGGEVVALIGNLGTGKTHLIKGISQGLDAPDMTQVNSPTFVLINEYEARGGEFTVYHIDAYRLDSVAEFAALGFEDYCRPDAMVFVEWADKVWSAMEGLDVMKIELEHVSENQRKIVISGMPEHIATVIEVLFDQHGSTR